MRNIAKFGWLVLGGFVACTVTTQTLPDNQREDLVGPQAPAFAPDAGVAQPGKAAGASAGAFATNAGALATPSLSPETQSAACPGDMKLVSGDYCTKADTKCLRSWYARWNDKTVCEEFAANTACSGHKVPKRFCMDTYEWPNVKGERPEVMNRFHQAQIKCAAVGKRMCTESEWNMACEGPDLKPYPYGTVRDSSKCNGDHKWDNPDMKKVAQRDPTELARLWQGVRSGTQSDCISDYGVADMPGNADEVVASEHYTNADITGMYDSVHTGGPWYEGVRNQCRPKVYTHKESFYYYFLSFRCCSEADGQPTDPRTPRQLHEGSTLEQVQRLAGFTVEQMKAKLDLKKQGRCDCAPKDIGCKTMCGTLLGPNAQDAIVGEKRGQFGTGPGKKTTRARAQASDGGPRSARVASKKPPGDPQLKAQ